MKNYFYIKMCCTLMLISLNFISFSQPTGQPCNSNTFWAMQGSVIEEFTLINNVVTFVGNVWSGTSIDANLAYCTNLDGGSYSPTFYSSFNYQQPRYFDGTNWITASASVAPDKIFNPGSNGTHLYYMLVDQFGGSYAKAIVRYDGNAFTTVCSWDTTRKVVVADLAVDSMGNVFICMGNNDNLNITDTIMLVSPTGQIIQQYPFAFDTYNAYGCFLLNGILYIGLGNGNTTNPSTLVPVTFSGNTATAGIPISHSASADLASCNANLQLAMAVLPDEKNFSIYPNPSSRSIRIHLNQEESKNAMIKIFDVMGKTIWHGPILSSQTSVDVSAFENGIYFVQLSSTPAMASGPGIRSHKILVQHE